MSDAPRAVAQLAPGDRVVIVGAGPAGLTAAYLLAKHGVAVTVLEGDDVVGGISRTAQYRGFRFDIGGHRFFTKIRPVEELWHEILGPEFISVPRLSRIHYDGKYFDYPLKAGNALSGLGLWNAALIVLSYLKAHFWPNPVEENLEQWVTNRFGKRLYEIFFKTYTEKVWGIPCTEIRAEWAAQRIQGLSLAKAVLTAASLNKRSTAIKTLINEFQYPRLGPGQMWETATARVREWGGQVRPRRGRGAQLPGLPHRRPHGGAREPLPGQLDLHPHAGGEGRAHPELQQLEPGDGPGAGEDLPRPRVLLLRGGRAVDESGRGARRA